MKVDPDPEFPCSECDKMLTQKVSLRVHMMARHTGEKPLKSAVNWDNDDKADKKNSTFADSEESTDTSADEEESDPDECLTTNLDKSENRFRGSARLLAEAIRQHSERV